MAFSDTGILINSSQFLPGKSVIMDGCHFRVAINLDANKTDMVYWSTRDKKFVIPEGFCVGMTFGDIRKTHSGELFEHTEWGYFYHFRLTEI